MKKSKKLTAILLSALLAVSALPAAVFAADPAKESLQPIILEHASYDVKFDEAYEIRDAEEMVAFFNFFVAAGFESVLEGPLYPSFFIDDDSFPDITLFMGKESIKFVKSYGSFTDGSITITLTDDQLKAANDPIFRSVTFNFEESPKNFQADLSKGPASVYSLDVQMFDKFLYILYLYDMVDIDSSEDERISFVDLDKDGSYDIYIKTLSDPYASTEDLHLEIYKAEGTNLKGTQTVSIENLIKELRYSWDIIHTIPLFAPFYSATFKFSDEKPASENKPTEKEENLFSDVKESSWYYKDVAEMYEKGLMSGTGADKFSPNEPTERAMIVTVIFRMAHYPNFNDIILNFDEPCPFSDVKEGSWYEGAVRWAAKVGIASGYEDGTFRPHEKITRQELAQFIYQYAQFEGLRNMYAIDDLSGFSDSDKVGSWAKEAFGWTVAQGVMSGFGEDTLAPRETATRAHLAATMNRLHVLIPPAVG